MIWYTMRASLDCGRSEAMHTHLNLRAVLLPLVALLTACGQTGPLYLPGNPSQIETTAPAESQESDEEKEKDDDQGT